VVRFPSFRHSAFGVASPEIGPLISIIPAQRRGVASPVNALPIDGVNIY
jgi:hypothetical protein